MELSDNERSTIVRMEMDKAQGITGSVLVIILL